jgi:hypothetical protein
MSQQTKPKVILTKPKVHAPPMYYQLSMLSPFDTLSQIGNITHGFNDIPIELARWIHFDVLSRQFTTFGYIPAPPNMGLVKKIIGIDGYYLKLTTQNHSVNFIWHDRTSNEFHFWGEYNRCIRAMNEIRYRICKVVDAAREEAAQAEEAQAEEQADEHVFSNDVYSNDAVCAEAFVTLNINGDLISSVTKFYPENK